MPRFSYEDADKYGSKGGGANFFQLKQDGETAKVHLLGNDMNDFPGYAVHRVPVGDSYRYVNCLREAGAPVSDCPFCAEGSRNKEVSKVHAKLFIPLYDCATDEIKIWERGKTFFRDLASYCSHNPNVSEVVTEVERRGKPNDTSTTYGLYALKEDDGFNMQNVADDMPEILGNIVLDKSKSDMEYYLQRGSFPDGDSAGVARRGSSRDDRPPFNEGNERRTPSRRRDAEDEY